MENILFSAKVAYETSFDPHYEDEEDDEDFEEQDPFDMVDDSFDEEYEEN